jgi:hypothetical protein
VPVASGEAHDHALGARVGGVGQMGGDFVCGADDQHVPNVFGGDAEQAVHIGQLPGQRVLIGQGWVTFQRGQHRRGDLRRGAVPRCGELSEPRGAFCQPADRHGEPAIAVLGGPGQRCIRHAADQDGRDRGGRGELNYRAIWLVVQPGGLAGDQAGKDAQRGVGAPTAFAPGHPGRGPRRLVTVAASANTEDHPAARYVLERGDLLGDPDDGVQRKDHHAEPEADPGGGPGRGRQRDRAVDQRCARTRNKLVNRPHRLQAEVLGMPRRRGDVSRQFPRPAHAGEKYSDIRPWHGLVPSIVRYLSNPRTVVGNPRTSGALAGTCSRARGQVCRAGRAVSAPGRAGRCGWFHPCRGRARAVEPGIDSAPLGAGQPDAAYESRCTP